MGWTSIWCLYKQIVTTLTQKCQNTNSPSQLIYYFSQYLPKTSLVVISLSQEGDEKDTMKAWWDSICFFDIVHCLYFVAEKCNMPRPKNTLDTITKADGTSFLWKLTLNGTSTKNKGCVVTLWPCHFTFKKYLTAKEELWKLKYFHHAKI